MPIDPLVVAKFTVIISCIPILVALYQRKFLNKPLFAFLTYKILTLLVNVFEQFLIWYSSKYFETIEPYINYFEIQDTSFIGILFYVLVFIFIGKFYRILLGVKNNGKTVIWISYLLLLSSLVNYFFIEGYRVYGKFNPAVTAIFMFGVPVYYLFYLFKSNLALPIRQNPYFWLSLGVILPNLIGVFLFFVGDVVHKEDYQLFTILSSFKNAFLILGHILIAIGFWNAPYAKYITLPDEK
jgi:hypothetical protein